MFISDAGEQKNKIHAQLGLQAEVLNIVHTQSKLSKHPKKEEMKAGSLVAALHVGLLL